MRFTVRAVGKLVVREGIVVGVVVAGSARGRVTALSGVAPVAMVRRSSPPSKGARKVSGRCITSACSGPATRLARFAVVRCRGVSWSYAEGESGRATEAQR